MINIYSNSRNRPKFIIFIDVSYFPCSACFLFIRPFDRASAVDSISFFMTIAYHSTQTGKNDMERPDPLAGGGGGGVGAREKKCCSNEAKIVKIHHLE